MKTKEVFLSVVAFALLLTTFCIVALTAKHTDNLISEPARHPSSAFGKTESNSTTLAGSTGNLGKTVQEPERNNALPAASARHPNSRPGKPKIETRSVHYQEILVKHKGSDASKNIDNHECLEGSQAPDPNEIEKQADPKSIE